MAAVFHLLFFLIVLIELYYPFEFLRPGFSLSNPLYSVGEALRFILESDFMMVS